MLRRFEIDRLGRSGSPVKMMRHVVGDVEAHWHDYYEFVYVLEGSAIHQCNGLTELVTPGSAALVGPTDIHSYSAHGGTDMVCYNLAIESASAETSMSGLLGLHEPTGLWTVSDLTASLHWLQQLERELHLRAAGSARMVQALLDCVLISFARALPVGGPGEQPADAMAAAAFFIEQHFREPLTLAAVAGRVHLSAHYFSERFAQHTGSTFQTYLQHRRLHFARSLLRTTDLSIHQVTVASGFGDANHFGRAYRRRYGQAPSVDRHDLVSEGS